MKRWHEDKARLERQRRLYREHVPEHPDHETEWVDEIGRYRKKKAMDCGKTHCFICHSDKFPRRCKHEHEIMSDLSFREQLKDMG